MIQRIKALSLDTVNKIAAGEVVERPASVIKELLENSIDAQSNNINITLSDAGKKLISVRDNGTGIVPEDIELAFQRHTTSKIQNSEDLFEIHTLGFRGEALSAIASVSRLTAVSKNKDHEYGTSIYIEFGNIRSKDKKAGSTGTTIIVEDLYSNTPARLKFLKTSSTELSHCINMVNNYATAYPTISFSLEHNNKTVLSYDRTSNFEDRIRSIYGKDDKWLTKNSAYEYVSGELYIKDPSKFSEKTDFKIFINGRAVKDRVCAHALSSAFQKHLSSGSAPACVLFLNIEPAFVDMNVSPTKNEVRFRESNLIHSFIQSLVDLTLKKDSGPTKNTFNNTKTPAYKNDIEYSKPSENISLFDELYGQTNTEQNLGINILGQFQKQYLVIEEKGSLVIIDQHAAHERINFEDILRSFSTNKEVQNLLVPELIEFNISSSLKFKEKISELKELGFDIEEFSDNNTPNPAFIVRSIPKIMENINIKELFSELLLEENNSKQGFNTRIAMIAARLGCHDSIRGERTLNKLEAIELINKLNQCEYPHTCPHGRPIKISFSLDEIEKLFKRK